MIYTLPSVSGYKSLYLYRTNLMNNLKVKITSLVVIHPQQHAQCPAAEDNTPRILSLCLILKLERIASEQAIMLLSLYHIMCQMEICVSKWNYQFENLNLRFKMCHVLQDTRRPYHRTAKNKIQKYNKLSKTGIGSTSTNKFTFCVAFLAFSWLFLAFHGHFTSSLGHSCQNLDLHYNFKMCVCVCVRACIVRISLQNGKRQKLNSFCNITKGGGFEIETTILQHIYMNIIHVFAYDIMSELNPDEGDSSILI